MQPDFCIIDRNDFEWKSAWSHLIEIEAEYGRDRNNPEDYPDGEPWEYMDTEEEDGNWVHCFRIRIHPKTGDRVYLRIPVTPGWEPNPADFFRATEFAARVQGSYEP